MDHGTKKCSAGGYTVFHNGRMNYEVRNKWGDLLRRFTNLSQAFAFACKENELMKKLDSNGMVDIMQIKANAVALADEYRALGYSND